MNDGSKNNGRGSTGGWTFRSLLVGLGMAVAMFSSFMAGSILRHRYEVRFVATDGKGAPSDDDAEGPTMTVTEKNRRILPKNSENVICNSSVDESTRLWIYLDADDVEFTNNELVNLTKSHPLWSDKLLSYHCLLPTDNGGRSCHGAGEAEDVQFDDSKTKKNNGTGGNCRSITTTTTTKSSYCIGVLRGGGNVVLRTAIASASADNDDDSSPKEVIYKPRSSLLYYSACGIGKGRDVGGVNDFVMEVKNTFMSRLQTSPPVVRSIGGTNDGDGSGVEREFETLDSSASAPRTTATLGESPVLWSSNTRLFQFRDEDKADWTNDPLRKDLGLLHLQSSFRRVHKEPIFSTETHFQRFDVYDFINPKETSYESHIKSSMVHSSASAKAVTAATYENQHPELFQPNRILFLDGVEQSTRRGLEAYHEALVQPGMFAHSDPRRVAIVGGGEGATLREVLKHDTVEAVTMIEIDQIMVEHSREYLPEWNTCGDIVGSVDVVNGSCFEDPRADMRYEDAMAWFLDRFPSPSRHEEEEEERKRGEGDNTKSGFSDAGDDSNRVESVDPFDVVIMDALDPSDNVGFADVLYNNDAFFRAVYDGLTQDGILVMQQGELDFPNDVPPECGEERTRTEVMFRLRRLGFVGFHEYSESHAGFKFPWLFLIACKSTKCNENYFANPARLDVLVRKRMRPTRSGKPSLSWVDGNTLRSYQVPRRVVEDIFCRTKRKSKPADCYLGRGMDGNMPYFRVEDALLVEDGRRFVAKIAIPRMSYLEAGAPLQFESSMLNLMKCFGGATRFAVEPIAGHEVMGLTHVGTGLVPAGSSILRRGDGEESFDAAINVGTLSSLMTHDNDWKCTTSDVDMNDGNIVGGAGWAGGCNIPRNPVVARHTSAYGGGVLVTLRDITAGEQIVFG